MFPGYVRVARLSLQTFAHPKRSSAPDEKAKRLTHAAGRRGCGRAWRRGLQAPLTDEEVKATSAYKILMQFSSPKDIAVAVSNTLWPAVPGLPPMVKGKVLQWVNKSLITIRILWEEAEGGEAHDTTSLHQLLEHNFVLVRGPRGEALNLRGANAAEAAAAQPKRTIDVKYMAGAEERTRTWTVESNPEAITVDARTAPRFRASINRRPQDIDTKYKFWRNAMLPPKLIDNAERFFNLRLDGKSRRTRKTTKGEIVRFFSYLPALALFPGVPIDKMWQQVRGPKDVAPPMAFGQHGMGKSRFEKLIELAGQMYDIDAKDKDTDNDWRFSEMPVDCFNEHMSEVLTPGWNIGPDESGSAWRGREGKEPNQCPHVSCIERKPEPLCCELVDVACADSRCIIFLEINKGKEANANKKYADQYAATPAINLRLSEAWHNTERAWGGDSWFTGMAEMEAGLEKGMWPYGDLKTHTSGVPVKELIEAVGPNSGDWAVFTTILAGKLVYAIGHRRGGTVHTYLSSHGQTLMGKPQSHKDDVEALGYMAVARPCPKILNDWTAMQPQIDTQNKWRQRELAMEKRFVTQSFPFRLFITVLGMTLGNTHAGFNRFVKTNTDTFLQSVAEIAYDGMHNNEDGPAMGEDGLPNEDCTPGATSPFASPTRAAAEHKHAPCRFLAGYIGGVQLLCSVCSMQATLCCTKCSNADKIFMVCNPALRPCMAAHKANLTDEAHKLRRPSGQHGTKPAKGRKRLVNF